MMLSKMYAQESSNYVSRWSIYPCSLSALRYWAILGHDLTSGFSIPPNGNNVRSKSVRRPLPHIKEKSRRRPILCLKWNFWKLVMKKHLPYPAAGLLGLANVQRYLTNVQLHSLQHVCRQSNLASSEALNEAREREVGVKRTWKKPMILNHTAVMGPHHTSTPLFFPKNK